jgi:hypothetical protein
MIVLYTLLSGPAFADRIAYGGSVSLEKVSDTLSVQHRHDWSNPLHVSSIKVVDRRSGKELFTKPVPALTYLWISPDSRYIVGLSNIKYLNQYQLIVLSSDGQELLKQDLRSTDWAQATESVSNWINWYKPEPKITLNDAARTVQIEDAGGIMRSFPF